MASRLIILVFLVFALGGCSAKPASPKDPCLPEFKECVKQFVTEKLYCVTSGETETRCQELYELGLKECRATHVECAASQT